MLVHKKQISCQKIYINIAQLIIFSLCFKICQLLGDFLKFRLNITNFCTSFFILNF